ncbi:oligosaccharide flippase family protein [Riemerella anatipestifer]|uniref:oligosaccharide flippase family protein n=1 Tax=Riemerella anatipestifer TaxID=34085 RepID=UPI002A8F98BD|nr:oligosaccharide flippase family protein [Riemerella anatipestifer]
MLKKILKNITSKEGKVLLENFLSLSVLQVVGMILPLISLPYVLRVIGFEKYGIIVFASSFIAYFTSLTDYSFKLTATRSISVNTNSAKKMSLIYSKVMSVKLVFLIISLLIIGLIVFLTPVFKTYYSIYFFTSLMLVGQVLFPEWFFQGIQKMKYITILNLSVKIFFTICIFLFIKTPEDFWIYPLLQSMGYIAAGLIAQYIIVKKYHLVLSFIPMKYIISTVKVNFPVFVNQFIPTLYNNTSTFLLGVFSAKELVGIYQAIITVVNLCITLLEILSRVFFPFLNRKKHYFFQYKKMMLIVVSLMFLGILILHKYVFWYLDVTYMNAFEILLILSLGLFGYTLYNIFGVNYFIVNRLDKLVMKNTVLASLIGFIVGFPLIYYFSIFGAAINLTLARFIMGGGLFLQYKKIKSNE